VSINTKQFIESAITTDGIVVDFERYDGTYHPVVTFTAPDNITFRFTSSMGSSPPTYIIGQQIKVIYDPASPSKARIRDFWSLWGLAAIFGIIGLPSSSGGLGTLLYIRLRERTIRRLGESDERIEPSMLKIGVQHSYGATFSGPRRSNKQAFLDLLSEFLWHILILGGATVIAGIAVLLRGGNILGVVLLLIGLFLICSVLYIVKILN